MIFKIASTSHTFTYEQRIHEPSEVEIASMNAILLIIGNTIIRKALPCSLHLPELECTRQSKYNKYLKARVALNNYLLEYEL